MADPAIRVVTVADHNLGNLNGLLAQDEALPPIEPIETPFGQVHQTLMNPAAECWRARPEAALIWVQAEAAVPLFGKVVRAEPVDRSQVLEQVAAWATAIRNVADLVPAVFVVSWTRPARWRGLGILDLRPGQGIADLLARMNLCLADHLADQNGVYMLDAHRWLATSTRPFPPKSFYMAKFAFGNEVLREAVADIKAGLLAVRGQSRKLVVLDLDGTLWGGVVGEVGWQGVALGGHDPIGEAFVGFQTALKVLARRGLLLGIVSKNEESVALEAIDKHPDMQLRREDFAGWRINWRDKAQNLIDLVAEIDLGLQSVVFIDDNPVERARVRDMLPEVLVPEWPKDTTLFARSLAGLRCFDKASLSDEDHKRTAMYAVERERRATKHNIGSIDEWLASLETVVTVAPLSENDLARAAQLFNKTNQMNMTTRRMSERELMDWATEAGHWMWTFRVSDKFGDSGLTGIISLVSENGGGCITDFVLSCRVMGRHIEDAMVSVAVAQARAAELEGVVARLIETNKNQPCRLWWEGSIFTPDPKNALLFRLPPGVACDPPAHLELKA